MALHEQASLFDDVGTTPPVRAPAPASSSSSSSRGMPEGFRYQANLLSADEERELVRQVETLPFKEFEFQGFLGKRRVVSFGWRYDFNDRQLQTADNIPPFLLPLRQRAAAFAGIASTGLQHCW